MFLCCLATVLFLTVLCCLCTYIFYNRYALFLCCMLIIFKYRILNFESADMYYLLTYLFIRYFYPEFILLNVELPFKCVFFFCFLICCCFQMMELQTFFFTDVNFWQISSSKHLKYGGCLELQPMYRDVQAWHCLFLESVMDVWTGTNKSKIISHQFLLFQIGFRIKVVNFFLLLRVL